MQFNRCPVCHSRISLEQLCQDEAGRELLALLAKLDSLSGTAVVSYIGLFRSAKRDLTNDRALKLTQETLALAEPNWLIPALQETVESIRVKRQQGQVQPLTNHNYLKRVLSTVLGRCEDTPVLAAPNKEGFRTGNASIERLNDISWAD